MDNLQKLKTDMYDFAVERDWLQFQTPKNLAMALTAEAGELLECFQWLNPEQSENLSAEQRLAVADEIADVQLYLVRLADSLDLDIYSECKRKIQLNAAKYPAQLVKGSSKKYTAYKLD
ncbi:MAG: hypothetical protein OFPI_25770 [Osedax symbiont Rs2]|nr:MAG: hypothetical protein OFPI_25770 [Osedax symbiont Rs2]